jgi:cell division transport system permease protein
MTLSTLITSYLLRHLQVMLFSLGQLWRQPIASLMTITVIGIALSLPAGLFVLQQNLSSISSSWEDSNQISLFLTTTISESEGKQLAKDIKTWPSISQVDYQSQEQSLAEFRQLSGLGELVDSLPHNPLPSVIVVYPQSDLTSPDALGSLLARLDALPQVEQAQLDMEWLQRLKSINKIIHRGIGILAILLFLGVLLIIGNTIRLAILSRQSEIKVMKLVGATDRFVRRPFLYTGFWYGLLGGILAWLTLITGLTVISSPIDDLILQYSSGFTMEWFALSLFLTLPFVAVVLGVTGAWLAVSRHINLIEPN